MVATMISIQLRIGRRIWRRNTLEALEDGGQRNPRRTALLRTATTATLVTNTNTNTNTKHAPNLLPIHNMSVRTTSGKFSLANLGFKSENTTHSRQTSSTYDDAASPNGSSAFDKLGKKLAHTTLLPALGNKDLRSLQE